MDKTAMNFLPHPVPPFNVVNQRFGHGSVSQTTLREGGVGKVGNSEFRPKLLL